MQTSERSAPVLPTSLLDWPPPAGMAPEVITGGRCSEKVDLYSIGVLLWEICTGPWVCGRASARCGCWLAV